MKELIMNFEELRKKNKQRIINHAFAIVLQRGPTEQERNHWLNINIENNYVKHMLSALHNKNYLQYNFFNNTEQPIYFYVDHVVKCPGNTGIQRVTRNIAHSWLKSGKSIIFVKWSAVLQRLIRINRLELNHLAQWSGPRLNDSEIINYPATDEDSQLLINDYDVYTPRWLFIPEVTHINYHRKQLTLDIILAAKKLNLLTAFLFYDATPLRRAELEFMVEYHESYMRQLMHADLIIPISQWAGVDLIEFLMQHERCEEAFLPKIHVKLLPAEVPDVQRVTKITSDYDISRIILSVGTITPHKNQFSLIKAFSVFLLKNPRSQWRLHLVGSCDPNLKADIDEICRQFPAIQLLGNVDDDELTRAYHSAAFTVFPSITEGYGLPIAESLWFGKPCVCANFGPMAEIAAEGGCFTCDTTNVNSLESALCRMIEDRDLRKQLTIEARTRRLESWSDYAENITQRLEEFANPLNRIGKIYFIIEHTSTYPQNSGIQRVVRGLAAALMRLGAVLIPAKWNEHKDGLEPPLDAELEHLSGWNGPPAHAWHSWQLPKNENWASWVVTAELTPHYLPQHYQNMRKFLNIHGMRGACIFHDTIPWKLKEIYSPQAREGHKNYMLGINEFELILAISKYSRTQLEKFLSWK